MYRPPMTFTLILQTMMFDLQFHTMPYTDVILSWHEPEATKLYYDLLGKIKGVL